MTQSQLREQVTETVRGLKSVRSGETFENARVREVLRQARKLELRLDRLLTLLFEHRRKAEKAFCEGWREHPFTE